MESFIFALILITTTFAPAASMEALYASENPVPVGGNVTLYSQADVQAAVWMFDTEIIVLMLEGNALITKNWTHRAILNSNSSLTISSLQQNDSGIYTLVVVNSHRAQLTLTVQVPISNVTTWANATHLVEFNDTVVLKCSAHIGSHMSYAWLRNGSAVIADERVKLSDGDATLTIVGVTRHDQWFSCNVSNGVSHESSHPLYLNISYGPSNPSMMIMPMKLNYVVGSNITLSCSAESSPPATIQWMFNGENLNQSGPELQLQMVSDSQSGDYQCIFYNSVTSKFNNISSLIRILDPQKHIQVETSMNPANEGDAYQLTCNITAAATHVHWLKNGEPLHEDNTTVFNMDNTTVNISALERHHAGSYECMATTALWILTSHPYELVVNYGPETPMVWGPDFAAVGQNAVFNCSAVSMPPSHFSWWFHGSEVGNSSVFTMDILSTSTSGEITCKAYNLVTGKNARKSKMLTVIQPIQSVMIRNNTVPIDSKDFTLTCNVTGTNYTIHWMKDNTYLNMTPPSVNPTIENNMLHFTPLTLHHEGTYQCVATNLAGSHNSPEYQLLVNYGPLSVTISNPNQGPLVSMTCSAVSRPQCDFHWSFNGQLFLGLQTGPTITFPATQANQGIYTCTATNPVTHITMSQTKAYSAAAFSFPSQAVVTMMGLFALSLPVMFV
ncbi:uncharacterized protein ACO6RY_12406 [Pungitius sinensis]